MKGFKLLHLTQILILKQRYFSLDVFRGATVAFMILVNNPGTWSHVYPPFRHADWHGITPTDLVFPFFLFAVGNALAFVMPRFEAAGSAAFWKKIVKRSFLIFAIGLFLNWFPFVQWQDNEVVFKGWTWVSSSGNDMGVRILGVLQRIALCYFFAAIIIFYTKPRGAFVAASILLLIYWALCVAGNPADPYSLAGWFGTGVDKAILGAAHMYHGEQVAGVPIAFDPEGLVSTLPAISEVIFGFLVGDFLRRRSATTGFEKVEGTTTVSPIYQTLTVLFVAAAALMVGGYVWDYSFPINKKIWTSSYVIYTVGLATVVLALLIYLIELKNHRGRWTRFFDVFGKNALFIYALSGLIPKIFSLIRIPVNNGSSNKSYTSLWGSIYENVFAHVPGAPENGSLLFAISFVLLLWAVAYWMDKKGVYVKV